MAVIDAPIEAEPVVELQPTVAEDIDRMILYIEEHGWCQSRYQDDQGRVCISGAIFRGPPPLSGPDSRQEKVISAIHQAVMNVVIWNDTPGRTEAEVLDFLRRVRDSL